MVLVERLPFLFWHRLHQWFAPQHDVKGGRTKPPRHEAANSSGLIS